MKIDNSIKGLATRTNATTARNSTPAAKAPEASGAQVELSSASLLHSGNASSVSGSFDAQRVAEIRQAIAEGRFQINPERIADGLVNSVREMLSQQRRSSS